MTNRRIVLAARPDGEPKDEDFRMEEGPVPSPGDGQVLVRTIYLSLDPYMRARMTDAPSYAAPVALGEVMVGETVGEVVASNAEGLEPGDLVTANSGWQEYAIQDARAVRKIERGGPPVSTRLGVLGMPGFTAYTGLLDVGQPKAGETLAVAAAAGPVGSAGGQIAKIRGCRVVGIAGGPEKCDYLRRELGFDAAVDHRAAGFEEGLAAACPAGIDIYFENVGGKVLRAVLPLLNQFGRVPVCGLVADYSMKRLPRGVDLTPRLMSLVLTRRLTLRGFIVWDFAARRPDFERDMRSWLEQGRVKYREDVVDGLENAVGALRGLLQGRNFGKLLVRVGPDGR